MGLKANSFGKDLVWLFGGYGVRFLLSFIVGLQLARNLGVEKFGIFNYCLGIISLVYVFCKFGMETVITKILVDKGQTEIVLGTSYMINVILLLISFFFLNTLNLDYKKLILFLSIGLFFRSFDIVQYYLFVQSKGSAVAKITLIIDLMANGFKIIFLLCNLDFNVLFTILFAIDLLTGAIYIYAYTKTNKKITAWKVNFALIKEMFLQSFPFFISSLAVTMYMKMDQIIIQNLLGNSAVGIYAVAVRLIEIWYFIPSMIISVTFPKILKINNKEQADEAVQTILEILAFIAIVIMALTVIFAELIISYTYGKQFLQAVPTLQLYSVVLIFTFLGSFRGRLMIIENLQGYLIVFGIIGVIFNAILNYLLIPLYGLEGSAVASIITLVCTNHLLLVVPEKTRYIFHLQNKSIANSWRIIKNIQKLNLYKTIGE